MARTQRSYMTDGNRREARHGRATLRRAWAAADALPEPGNWQARERRKWEVLGITWGTRHTRGGMLMSSRSSGAWDDEPHDTRMKRAVKRSQRQTVRDEIAAELAGF